MSSQNASLGIQRVASVHLFVRDLERSRDHYIRQLDFAETAVSTLDFEQQHHARASVLEAGGARLVFMEPIGSAGESFEWLQKHPEGVGRVVFEVADVARAFALLTERGATHVTGMEREEVEGGQVAWFDIATALGDTLFRFVQYHGDTPMMPKLQRHATPRGGENRLQVTGIDHITANYLTLKPVVMWLEQVMGFASYWDVAFHTQDVKPDEAKGGSGLRSIVMWDPDSGFKLANNEPAAPAYKASQIYVFCEDHRGPGIQHIALAVNDIVSTVGVLRKQGVPFQATPSTYYDLLPDRLQELGIKQIDEDVDLLRELQILVDGHSPGRYLLQIFMREASHLFHDPNAGPLFIELVQRKGDKGFGAGNFRALFESIERQHELEGRAGS